MAASSRAKIALSEIERAITPWLRGEGEPEKVHHPELANALLGYAGGQRLVSEEGVILCSIDRVVGALSALRWVLKEGDGGRLHGPVSDT